MIGEVDCPSCLGARVREDAGAVRFEGFTLDQVLGTDSHLFVGAEFHPHYDEVLRLLFDEGQTSKFEFEDVNGTWWDATLVPVKHDDRVEQVVLPLRDGLTLIRRVPDRAR